jgi:ubiquinone/menaquinone biosynthesis C-methylase UbiE
MSTHTIVPNHHAHHPGFAGASGLLAATTMLAGRGPTAQLTARLAGVGAGETVVDLGCGPGAAVRLARRLGATVVGVDPSTEMLRVARLVTRPRARIRWIEGVAESVPLDDASADVVWSIATVHHWTDIDDGLDEVRRILRPGGRFVAIERQVPPGAHGLASHGWADEQAAAFAASCEAHGFVEVRADLHPVRGESWAVVAVTPAG